MTILNWKDHLKCFSLFPNGIAGRKWVNVENAVHAEVYLSACQSGTNETIRVLGSPPKWKVVRAKVGKAYKVLCRPRETNKGSHCLELVPRTAGKP